MSVIDDAQHEPLPSNTLLDRATADLFELDVRMNPVSVPYSPNCSDTTNDGCSAECPSIGCTPTCRC